MNSSIIRDLNFIKYANILQKSGHAFFDNFPTTEPEGMGFVYLWVEIDGQSKTIVYVGKAGKTMRKRCFEHDKGFSGISKSAAALRNSEKICQGIASGKNYNVYYRKSETMTIFDEKISIHCLEEEALINKLKNTTNKYIWNS